MCERAVEKGPYNLKFAPDHLKTREMCERAIEDKPETLEFVPDHLKTRGMSERAVEDETEALEFVPDHLKTKGMCEKAVEKYPSILIFVLDWFVMQGQVKVWHDHNYYCDDYETIDCYDGCKKRKAQKAQIDKKLMPIAWHPSRWWNSCVPEDEKKVIEKLWV